MPPRSTGKKKHKEAPPGQFPLMRVVALCVVLLSILVLSRQGDPNSEYSSGVYEVPCKGEEWEGPKSCTPQKCSRAIFDGFVTNPERLALIALMESGLSQGDGGAGGAAIFDLASGAVSHGRQFINAFAPGEKRFVKSQLDVFADVVSRVKNIVESNFGSVGPVLTSPCFFSQMNGSQPAVTAHDEYWHSHVDKLQYEGFIYTALLYLSDHGVDFEGGQFAFEDGEKVTLVSPRPGRLVIFTSGSENTHRVLRVTKGIRRAITIAFSCNPKKAVKSFLKQAYTLT